MASVKSSTAKKAVPPGDAAKKSRSRTPKPAVSPEPAVLPEPKKKVRVLQDVSGPWEMKPGNWPKPDSLKVLKELPEKNKASYKKNYFIVNTTERLIDHILEKRFKGNYDGLPESEWKKVERIYHNLTDGREHAIKHPMCNRGFASKYSKAKLNIMADVNIVPNKATRADTINKVRSDAASKAGAVRSKEITRRKEQAAAATAATAANDDSVKQAVEIKGAKETAVEHKNKVISDDKEIDDIDGDDDMDVDGDYNDE